MKAIIIDDEQDAVEFIHSIIKEYCKEIEVVGKAHNVKDGINLVSKSNVDLVFLDVEMPDGTGFNLLEGLPKRDFNVIFITAFNHYALQAIKYSAVDYVLKPINIQEFMDAVNKVKGIAKPQNNIEKHFSALLENLQNNIPVKIAVSTSDGIEYIETDEIIHIKADRSYSYIILKDGREILVSKNLGEFQELLMERNFFRPHNSHLINLLYVKKYVRSDGGYIKMINDASIPVSKTKKEMFLHVMDKLFN